MLFALGAASTALDAIQSLASSASSSSSQSTGFSQATADMFGLSGGAQASGSPAAPSGTTGFSQISPGTFSALLAAQSQSSTATATTSASTTSASTSQSSALQDLFSQIDGNGDGQITKSEFENALGAGGTNLAQADDVFNKLDTNGDGTVSLSELSSALKGKGGGHHHAPISLVPATAAARAPTDRAPIRCSRRCRRLPSRPQPVAAQPTTTSDTGSQVSAVSATLVQRRVFVLQCDRATDSARGQLRLLLAQSAFVQRLKLSNCSRRSAISIQSDLAMLAMRREKAARSRYRRRARSHGPRHWRRPCRVR